MKRKIELILRRFGLELAIYHYVFQKDHRRCRQSDRNFEAAHPEVILPPPRLRFDVIACSSAEYYFRTGQTMAQQIFSVFKKWCPGTASVVCEWGCGPGRILFPLADLASGGATRFIGTDAFAPSIHWAQTVPGDRISFMLNKMDPPLSLPDASMDFVYAVSVFTHLSDRLTRVWFTEILRILKPGGVFWFSTHGGSFHRKDLDPASLARLDRGEFVAIHSWHNGSQMYTGIHCPALMKTIIADSGSELLEYQPNGNQKYQDVWIIRKRQE